MFFFFFFFFFFFLSAVYQRLAARRGKKQAIMAVDNSIVASAFYMLSRTPYHELTLITLTHVAETISSTGSRTGLRGWGIV